MVDREIKAKTVRVVNPEGGVTEMGLEEALELAQQSNENVVVVNNNGSIPTVKICDYKKMMYDKKKKEKENKKNSSTMKNKEVQFNNSIAEHDLLVKAKNIDRLINEGNRVTVDVRYRGRSIRYVGDGIEKLNNLLGLLESKYKVDKEPKVFGSRVVMELVPLK